MNFGKWIVVSFVLFAAFIGVLVAVCVKEDVNLVSSNYYQEELAYQQKLDKKDNASQLTQTPVIEAHRGEVSVSFAPTGAIEKGILVLQRPADQRLDREFEWSPVSNEQHFNLEQWEPGLYRASLNWRMGGKDYYIEKLIVL